MIRETFIYIVFPREDKFIFVKDSSLSFVIGKEFIFYLIPKKGRVSKNWPEKNLYTPSFLKKTNLSSRKILLCRSLLARNTR